ncbi:MAG: S-methyl-5-thioribose-1-phosphate isomerase [Gammaproteobacteria bacterium]|nr:S-methyl-5-thioribose-1-phosphate isomerase [Gammaproteobacteria bacterium]
MTMAEFGIEALRWRDGVLELIDQRVLPHEERYLACRTAGEVAQAIRDMVVRGAPAIGIAAAYGVALAALAKGRADADVLAADLRCLAESRPTAVNLFWALDKMKARMAEAGCTPADLLALAAQIHADDIRMNQAMGELGAALIDGPCELYTHCNTGALATGGWGTALGVIRSAHAEGKVLRVTAGETRPWLQGARLTAWELQRDGIPARLACEGAAGSILREGAVRWVIVGADRITANGDTANKIGTYNLAVLARHHGVKFMVVAPSSTIDMAMESGELIPIEERPQHEVTTLKGLAIAPEGFAAANPSFDVTPAELIDAIVTERGVVLKPDAEKMRALMG